jgi:hypothetical protein
MSNAPPIVGPTAKSLLVGNPFGTVEPPRPEIPFRSRTARKHSLRLLRQYISELTFWRPGGQGRPPISFKIERKNFHISPPQNFAPVVFPSTGILPGIGDYQATGLGTYYIPESADVYLPGTVLQLSADYNEKFSIELWCTEDAERDAIKAGMEDALNPSEDCAGIRFRMPDYYNQTCCFVFESSQDVDDYSGQNRYKALIGMSFYVDVVRLVNKETFEPILSVDANPESAVVVGL